MWTLYDFLPSGNGYKVRLTLHELALPFQYREINILKGESRLPWFLAKNPVGQIPVLELDDGTCLSESSAILFFLAEGTDLLPSDRIARTRVLQWLCFEQTHVDGVISRARFRRRFPEVVPTRPEEFDAWWRDGSHALCVLDSRLHAHPYLVDDRFTIADIALYSYVHRAEEGGFDLSGYDALRGWFRRIEARPAYVPIDAPGGRVNP
jgi:glutathione S-transferase